MGWADRAPTGLPHEVARIAAMDLAALRHLWREVHDEDTPSGLSARLLRLALAWEVQADVLGRECAAERRGWARIEVARAGGASTVDALQDAPVPNAAAGTRLIRSWGGRSHEVVIHGDHVAWQGRRYRSLSAVARAITGTRRNGPAFFGLRDRERAP